MIKAVNTNSNYLTEKQLQFMNNIAYDQERKQKHGIRDIINAIFVVSENAHILSQLKSGFNEKN